MTITQAAKHTPGPWELCLSAGRYPFYISSANGSLIGDVYWDNELMDDANIECEANARLIAAAPSLAGALSLLLDAAKHAVCSGEDCFKCYVGRHAERVLRDAGF